MRRGSSYDAAAARAPAAADARELDDPDRPKHALALLAIEPAPDVGAVEEVAAPVEHTFDSDLDKLLEQLPQQVKLTDWWLPPRPTSVIEPLPRTDMPAMRRRPENVNEPPPLTNMNIYLNEPLPLTDMPAMPRTDMPDMPTQTDENPTCPKRKPPAAAVRRRVVGKQPRPAAASASLLAGPAPTD